MVSGLALVKRALSKVCCWLAPFVNADFQRSDGTRPDFWRSDYPCMRKDEFADAGAP